MHQVFNKTTTRCCYVQWSMAYLYTNHTQIKKEYNQKIILSFVWLEPLSSSQGTMTRGCLLRKLSNCELILSSVDYKQNSDRQVVKQSDEHSLRTSGRKTSKNIRIYLFF